MPRRPDPSPPPRVAAGSIVAAMVVTGVLVAGAADALVPRRRSASVRVPPVAERVVVLTAVPAPTPPPLQAAPPPEPPPRATVPRSAARSSTPREPSTARADARPVLAPPAVARDSGGAVAPAVPLRDPVRLPAPGVSPGGLVPLAPAGGSVRVIDGRLVPRSRVPTEVAGYDSALQERRSELLRTRPRPPTASERDDAMREAAFGAKAASAGVGPAPLVSAGGSIGIGLPGGGLSRRQRLRMRLEDSAARDVLDRLRRRADSIAAARRAVAGAPERAPGP